MRQGRCLLVDNEPSPPDNPGFESFEGKGWKEIGGIKALKGGGNFLFPREQILVVMENGTYKPITKDADRNLSALATTKTYLVWFHHIMMGDTCQKNHDDMVAN